MSNAAIRACREALKLTQKTAAQLAGVTEPTWQRFETGGYPIAPYLAARCMRLLNGEIPNGDLVASMAATLEEFDGDDELIADWAQNNMGWDEVKAHAKQVKEPQPPDYEDGWVNGAWEVGEWK
jgi:DNA-binding XRE family transcriptional regulator